MPIYQGGKAKIGKEIANFIENLERKLEWNGDYFEPFCGLLGVCIHLSKNRTVIANDKNKDLILMLDSLKKGWIPSRTPCSKDMYNNLRTQKSSRIRGFYGLSCAYSGIFFAGYRIFCGERNFFQTFRNQLLKMVPLFKNIEFMNDDYVNFIPEGMTIYCDPPYYDNSLQTSYFNNFNHDEFWKIMRLWSKTNLVIISEYQAPSDFVCIWKREFNSSFNYNPKKKRMEKLFMMKNSLEDKIVFK